MGMSDASDERSRVDDCAHEPIHTPGGIQPHGFLFVLNEVDLTVAAVSENAATVLGLPSAALIGRPISDFVVSSTAEDLDVLLRVANGGTAPAVRLRRATSTEAWAGLVNRCDGLILLELGIQLPSTRAETLFEEIRFVIDRIRHSVSMEAAWDTLASEIRRLTGFDRVMVYRFDPDWNGEVVAEDRTDDSDSYRGHSFPASDIPEQARALYLRNTIRQIPDATRAPSPLFPSLLDSTGMPVDLSSATLRAVSPVHLEYLTNMGVIASMSVSIVRNGRLWGLAACHHPSPRLLPHPVLQGCELLADAFAWFLDARQGVTAGECIASVRRLEAEISAQEDSSTDYRDRIAAIVPALLHQTRSSGLAICDAQGVWPVGEVPARRQILTLARWLDQVKDESFTTDRLACHDPAADSFRAVASGVAARKLGDGWLIFFRPEWRHTVTWAGEPAKLIKPGPRVGRINPRKSFASWHQSVRGRSRPWTVADRFAVDQIHSLVLRAILDDQRRLAQERRTLENVVRVATKAAHELNNQFQPIVSMAEMAAEDHASDAELIEALRVIGDSARQSAELMRGLLEYLRRSPKGARRSSLVESVESHVDALRVSLPPDIRLIFHTCPVPMSVSVDHGELGQIIDQLADNAMRAMQGHGQLTITLDELLLADGEAANPPVACGPYGRFTFADNGPGIPPARLERVFEPSFSHGEIGENTGLGLSGVEGIVRSWGGVISAVNLAEGGAAFTILLPIEDCSEPGFATRWGAATRPTHQMAETFDRLG
jgi:light-regulated signal transduction histidine kinase (bacteriophytochrome)